MTYANDCIHIKERERLSKLKRIDCHTTTELDEAIEKAARKFGPDFWMLLHGIDAYMERRKRRNSAREHRELHAILADADAALVDVWGSS